jgi:hypothetical protein
MESCKNFYLAVERYSSLLHGSIFHKIKQTQPKK